MTSWRNVAVVIGLLAATSAHGRVTEEQFKLRTGGDLLVLCRVSADDPLRDSAIHMCHGFGAGVGLRGGTAYDQHKKAEERAYRRGMQDGQQNR